MPDITRIVRGFGDLTVGIRRAWNHSPVLMRFHQRQQGINTSQTSSSVRSKSPGGLARSIRKSDLDDD